MKNTIRTETLWLVQRAQRGAVAPRGFATRLEDRCVMQNMMEEHSVFWVPKYIQCAFANRHRWSRAINNNTPRESEGMKAEAGLFFSSTGKCSLRYLAFINWTIAVGGTCTASITPLLVKEKVKSRAVPVWASWWVVCFTRCFL